MFGSLQRLGAVFCWKLLGVLACQMRAEALVWIEDEGRQQP